LMFCDGKLDKTEKESIIFDKLIIDKNNKNDGNNSCDKKDTNGSIHVIQEQKVRRMCLKDAVNQGIINNQTLGYFIGRSYLFLTNLGIKDEYLRFRQHKSDEMAHYAADCWDAEIFTSHGWIECVGIADRSCYDLEMHMKCSGVNLCAKRELKEPRIESKRIVVIDKKKYGKELKERMVDFVKKIEELSQSEIKKLEDEYKNDNKGGNKSNNTLNDTERYINFTFDNKSYTLPTRQEIQTIYLEEFIPSVIEPSFGIGRILYAIIEHNFWVREDERNVISFKPFIAPIKCVVTNLINKNRERNEKEKEKFDGDVDNPIDMVKEGLKNNNVKFTVCERNVSIGKKYSSYDEIGVPFFVTIDGDSLIDFDCTIRERDSMSQVRVQLESVGEIVRKLVDSEIDFDSLK